MILLLLITAIAGNYAQGPVVPDNGSNTGISIQQDPEKKILKVIYSSELRSDLSIKIKDESGKVVYSEKLLDEKFKHIRSLDISKYSKGVYIVEVDTQRAQDIERMQFN
ncbi:MAG: hypothetical protein JWO44_45 [Bacteroidetes bacterium]|nr:hypothetical protein [Bacteroidota bacterium]